VTRRILGGGGLPWMGLGIGYVVSSGISSPRSPICSDRERYTIMRTVISAVLVLGLLVTAAHARGGVTVEVDCIPSANGSTVEVYKVPPGDVGVIVRGGGGILTHTALLKVHEAYQLALLVEQAWREKDSLPREGGKIIGGVSGISVLAVNEAGRTRVSVAVHDVTRGYGIFVDYKTMSRFTTAVRTAAQ